MVIITTAWLITPNTDRPTGTSVVCLYLFHIYHINKPYSLKIIVRFLTIGLFVITSSQTLKLSLILMNLELILNSLHMGISKKIITCIVIILVGIMVADVCSSDFT